MANSDSAMVLHFEHHDQARLWMGAAMDTVGRGYPVPYNTYNFFCGGHATLPNGQLLVVGGTVESNGQITTATGDNRCAIFDPLSRSWRVADSTQFGRWYPTVTSLGDGSVLTTAGSQWLNAVMFGGVRDSASVTTTFNELRFLNLRPYPNWGGYPTGTRPSNRHGHGAVYANGFTVIYGGEADGVPKSDAWALYGPNTDRRRDYYWNQLTLSADPVFGSPAARSRHTAVVLNDTILIFGGRDENGNALNDLWLLDLNLSQNSGAWKKLSPATSPGARYGHVAGLAKSDRAEALMVVHGGRNASGHIDESNTIWELTLPRAGSASSPAWRQFAAAGNAPGKREGHTAVMLPVQASTPRTHRLAIFGGLTGGGTPTDSLFELRLKEPPSEQLPDWDWTRPTVPAPRPSPRMRHASVYDSEFNRLLVSGGDTDTTAGTGHVSDLWQLFWRVTGDSADWSILAADSTPVARGGHTLVFDTRPVESHIPERLDTTGIATGPGSWIENTSGPKYLPFYPFMFQLRDGKVFFAGNGPEHAGKDSSWLYTNPTSATLAKWEFPARTWTGSAPFLGGSAVYFPDTDRVMKCGGDDDVFYATDEITGSAMISGTTTTWTRLADMSESRTFHNLTALPDGRVLLTGGRNRASSFAYTRAPMIWDPFSQWGSPLVEDPLQRGYHSTALLLPDGRVLCSAGAPSARYASVYSPPYLFAVGDSLASRPVVWSYPTHTVHYGEPLYFAVTNAPLEEMAMVSLIRPGAVTHGFDQNQRYFKLPHAKTYGQLRAVLPTSSNHAPPGDYMVFAVRTGVGGVPSVARWIRVAGENDVSKPATVNDFEYGPSGNPVQYYCWWTAPGDDGNGPGAATGYQVRNSASAITNQNWSSAGIVASGYSARSGDNHLLLIGSSCLDGYFAVRAYDEHDNWSDVSNNWQAMCGGGGFSAERGRTGPAAAQTNDAAATQTLASRGAVLLPALAPGRRLGVTIANPGPDSMTVARFELVGVYDAADTVAVPIGGELVRGVCRQPYRVRSSLWGDITNALSGHAGAAGDTLVVCRQPGSQAKHLWIATTGADSTNGPTSSGIAIEIPGTETWSRVALRFPSSGIDARFESNALIADSVRLVLRGGYRFAALELMEPLPGSPAVRQLPITLSHSRMGLIAPEREFVLRVGEHITLSFQDTLSSAPHRLFALTEWSHATVPPSRQAHAGKRALPVAFALRQNEPNPFGEGTRIPFSVPVRAEITIEVFDVHGRRVRTLSRALWQPGHHFVSWDGRDEQGRRMKQGVYLYRMNAGSFRASRKLTLLP
jgi:hypothetical protein